MTATALAHHLAYCATLAALSAVAVWVMSRIGTLDVPGARSSHVQPTPKGGGIGIMLAFLVGMAVLYELAVSSRIAEPYFRAVLLSAMMIAVVGYLDDVLHWPAMVKLMAQVAAAVLAVIGGLSLSFVRLPVIGTIELGLSGPVITVAWIVAATNALNFIDGLNGLASGVTAISCAVLAVIGALLGAPFIYFSSLTLLAGVVGFLPFNFPHARIFMGDVGSQSCGFLLAVLAVAAGRFEVVDLSIALVPMLISGVLFDVAFTLVRRTLAGERLAQAHRGHLYQLAFRSGMPAIRITLIHWGFAVWGGVCCALFLITTPALKPFCMMLVLPPQIFWVIAVHRCTSRAGLTRTQLTGQAQ